MNANTQTHAHQIPLTQSQQMIWTGQTLVGQTPLYNMAWRFDLHLALDTEAFGQAFTHVFTRHDALNATFSGPAHAPVQTTRADLPPFPPTLDFSAEADPEEAAKNWCRTRAQRHIDLANTTYDSCLIKLRDDHWVWFLNQHHIATDAWSGALVFKAVADTYAAFMAGAAPAHSPAPKFADYATQTEPPSQDITGYWAEKTKDISDAQPPYGGKRDPASSASTRITIPFGQARTKALKALATHPDFRSLSADLSVYSLLMTGYAAFLSRVTGQSALTIGTPSHNRATPALKATPGLFIEMFPLGLDISVQDTFKDLFKRTMAETMGFLRHAKPGASTLQTAASFNAILNYIPIAYGKFAGAPTTTEWLHPGAHDPRHDLRLHVYDFNDKGAFTVEMDCNDAVFAQIDTQHLEAHFLAVMDALLNDPAQNIFELPLLAGDSDEAKYALQSGPDAPQTVSTVLEAIAARPSDAIACTQGAQSLSYAALNDRANRFASALHAKGVQSGDPVLIHAKRTPDLVAAMLGTLKAGGYFIPVPADAPKGRLAKITELSQPLCAITDADLNIPSIDIHADLPAPGPMPEISPDQPAYAIFTSGSTGEPKGVQVDHKNLAEYIRWAGQAFGPTGPKSYPLYSSIGFDLTLTSIFTPLTTGGQIVISPETGNTSDLAILDVFADDRVDVVKLTPAHLALLCEQGATPKRIKTLVLGGENLTTDLCHRAHRTLSAELTLLNEYGPTEAVVGCMIHRFDPTHDTGPSVPIGTPADNTDIFVLDHGLNPVPIGVTGQIYIGGRLATGYLNRPDLTAETFITRNAKRLYATGDLARTTPTGTIEYLGRADSQLKIGGIRVEPAEVEAAFTSIPGVTGVHITTHKTARPKPPALEANCTRCGISSTFPDTQIGADGICDICRGFESYKDRAQAYFKTEAELAQAVATLPSRKTGQYDAIMLLSGGKDSTYALYRLAELTRNILALTLDNGFISEGAKQNITRVTDDLGIDHRFMTTPAMNAIFNDSLTKHSNVCQGCFKTIYTLALETARREGIPAIVTGLSRGQFFETRLTPELFESRTPTVGELEQFVQDARKSYHGMDDAISQNLAITIDDKLLRDVEIIDIYRYIDVPVSELYDYLHTKGAWTRPDDTGRSTNCLINDVGIYVHKQREGFHNYALPYSWDVRMGHKTRNEAMDELDDEIDTTRVVDILSEIGFDQTLLTTPSHTQLVAYVTGDVNEVDLRAQVAAKLLPAMVPTHIIRLDKIPLTSNGKIDSKALPAPDTHKSLSRAAQVPPGTDREAQLAQIFCEILGVDTVSVTENFYDMGGDSIAAIQIAIRASDKGLPMDPNAVFEHQTIRELAASIATHEDAQTTQDADEPLIELGGGDLDALSKQLSGRV